MYYDRVSFADGAVAWREINANGTVTRYCDDDGVSIGRLYEPVSMFDGSPTPPAWAVADPTPEPDPTPDPAPVRRVSKLEYMNRFTDAELETIYSTAKVVVSVEVWLAKFNATSVEADGTSIDLDDPRTVGGLQAMEAAGLIAEGRAAEILGA